MADENGTLLARQVRRFVEKFPNSKVLENVEESAKTAILQLGNPEHHADESERTAPIPLEFHRKISFEAMYKKLKKEYPTLPDLKGNDEAKDQDMKDRDEREKEEREKEKRENEKREKEEREKEEREKEKREKEKREKEEREKKERDKKAGENNKGNLLDQLRAIPVEELRDLMQELGIRESSVNTTSSWNTRGSSADTSLQTSGPWQKVRETLGEDTGYWLDNLSVISRDNDCDFSRVKFFLEYLLRQGSSYTNSELTDLTIEFINDIPDSEAKFLKDLSEKDPELKRAYDRYYAPPQLLGETKERRPWARNPQMYRNRMFEGLPPEDKEDWDQITLHFDPDTKKKLVKGRITASVAEFLDVCLKSLHDNDEERHYLALKSEYTTETQRFEESDRGRLLTIKPQPKGSLKGRLKSDIKILNYSCAEQEYPDGNPRMYFFGIDKRKKKVLRAWARTTYCQTKEFKGGLDDLNDQRKECGQKEITTVSRVHRRWPNRDTGSNSDSDSGFESDG